MKRFKKLTKEDLQYIVDNSVKQSRIDIARQLNISVATLAAYTTQLRKLGVDIPKSSFAGNRAVMIEFAEEWKINHKKK